MVRYRSCPYPGNPVGGSFGDRLVVEQICRIRVGYCDVVAVLDSPEMAPEVADPRDLGGRSEADIALERHVGLVILFGLQFALRLPDCRARQRVLAGKLPVCGLSANCVPAFANAVMSSIVALRMTFSLRDHRSTVDRYWLRLMKL